MKNKLFKVLTLSVAVFAFTANSAPVKVPTRTKVFAGPKSVSPAVQAAAATRFSSAVKKIASSRRFGLTVTNQASAVTALSAIMNSTGKGKVVTAFQEKVDAYVAAYYSVLNSEGVKGWDSMSLSAQKAWANVNAAKIEAAYSSTQGTNVAGPVSNSAAYRKSLTASQRTRIDAFIEATMKKAETLGVNEPTLLSQFVSFVNSPFRGRLVGPTFRDCAVSNKQFAQAETFTAFLSLGAAGAPVGLKGTIAERTKASALRIKAQGKKLAAQFGVPDVNVLKAFASSLVDPNSTACQVYNPAFALAKATK